MKYVLGQPNLSATTHGATTMGKRTPEYVCWLTMRQRCNDKNHNTYKNYGARGISVCERWMKFENFLADMGEKPEGKSLDRIDVNGNYELGNCKWSTFEEQQNNRRDNVFVYINGVKMTCSRAARAFQIVERTIHNWRKKTIDGDITSLVIKRTGSSRPTTNQGFEV